MTEYSSVLLVISAMTADLMSGNAATWSLYLGQKRALLATRRQAPHAWSTSLGCSCYMRPLVPSSFTAMRPEATAGKPACLVRLKTYHEHVQLYSHVSTPVDVRGSTVYTEGYEILH